MDHEEAERWVNEKIGKGAIDKALAYEWLKKGLGKHTIPEDSILYLQGYRIVWVKEFREWGKKTDLMKAELDARAAKARDRNWFQDYGDFEEGLDAYLHELEEKNKSDYGMIDVWFVEKFTKEGKRDGKVCHYEFKITCTGHGGTVDTNCNLIDA